MSDPFRHLWIVGPGRLGLAFGASLLTAGAAKRVTFTGRRRSAPDHPIFSAPAVRYGSTLPADGVEPDLILLTVTESAIPAVAAELATLDLPPIPVLHASGALGSDELHALSGRGHPVGSIHPVAAIADPVTGADRLLGAWYGIEGEPAAIEAAERIVAAVKGRSLRVDPSGKPMYHAAAVFASNYVVALLSVAELLMQRAGVDEGEARAALTELARGAVADVSERGPVYALTGPVARGDVVTVERHLVGLSPDLRPLYSELARRALDLAVRRGLDSEAVRRVSRTLDSGTA